MLIGGLSPFCHALPFSFALTALSLQLRAKAIVASSRSDGILCVERNRLNDFASFLACPAPLRSGRWTLSPDYLIEL